MAHVPLADVICGTEQQAVACAQELARNHDVALARDCRLASLKTGAPSQGELQQKLADLIDAIRQALADNPSHATLAVVTSSFNAQCILRHYFKNLTQDEIDHLSRPRGAVPILFLRDLDCPTLGYLPKRRQGARRVTPRPAA